MCPAEHQLRTEDWIVGDLDDHTRQHEVLFDLVGVDPRNV
jgi:hypothetical protein